MHHQAPSSIKSILLDNPIMAQVSDPLVMGTVVKAFGSGWKVLQLWAYEPASTVPALPAGAHPGKARATDKLQPIPNDKPTDCVIVPRRLHAILMASKYTRRAKIRATRGKQAQCQPTSDLSHRGIKSGSV